MDSLLRFRWIGITESVNHTINHWDPWVAVQCHWFVAGCQAWQAVQFHHLRPAESDGQLQNSIWRLLARVGTLFPTIWCIPCACCEMLLPAQDKTQEFTFQLLHNSVSGNWEITGIQLSCSIISSSWSLENSFWADHWSEAVKGSSLETGFQSKCNAILPKKWFAHIQNNITSRDCKTCLNWKTVYWSLCFAVDLLASVWWFQNQNQI